MTGKNNPKGQRRGNIFILSVTSDIGRELAQKFLSDGYSVTGTYRKSGELGGIKSFTRFESIKCDIRNRKDTANLPVILQRKKICWDIFISCVGDLSPVGSFFKTDFDSWERSVHVNALDQLRILHLLYRFRRRKAVSNVVFFAGGGINKVVSDISAYTIGKIMLIKMCEYLDAENEDLNTFVIGPGWVKTKIHRSVVNGKRISKSRREETINFLKKGKGTGYDDIYESIIWLIKRGKEVSGGRNFSVVYDSWRGKNGRILAEYLKSNKNLFKLRRLEKS